jgi:hypothetical protein
LCYRVFGDHFVSGDFLAVQPLCDAPGVALCVAELGGRLADVQPSGISLRDRRFRGVRAWTCGHCLSERFDERDPLGRNREVFAAALPGDVLNPEQRVFQPVAG